MSNPTPLTANPYGSLVIAKIDNLFGIQMIFKRFSNHEQT